MPGQLVLKCGNVLVILDARTKYYAFHDDFKMQELSD